MRTNKARRVSLAVVALVLLSSACFLKGDAPPAEQAQQLVADGLSAHRAGDTASAEIKYKEAIEADPNNQFAHYNLGLVKQNTGSNAEAEASYRKAIELDPAFVEALFNLGVLLGQRQSHDEAIEMYKRVVEVRPEYAEAHLNLGFSYKALGRTNSAEKEFAKATELNPTLTSRIEGDEPKKTKEPQSEDKRDEPTPTS